MASGILFLKIFEKTYAVAYGKDNLSGTLVWILSTKGSVRFHYLVDMFRSAHSSEGIWLCQGEPIWGCLGIWLVFGPFTVLAL